MSTGTAKKWLVISALWVAGVWTYRRWREGPAAITELPKFFTGWGVVYFMLSLISEAAPSFGGAFAILVMTGDTLAQGQSLIQDVNDELAGKPPKGFTGSGSASSSSAASSPAVGNPSSQHLTTSQAQKLVNQAPALQGGGHSSGGSSSAQDQQTYLGNAAAIVATAPPLLPPIPGLSNLLR